jgi:hypothetical protein
MSLSREKYYIQRSTGLSREQARVYPERNVYPVIKAYPEGRHEFIQREVLYPEISRFIQRAGTSISREKYISRDKGLSREQA